jgi:hypothetical protein
MILINPIRFDQRPHHVSDIHACPRWGGADHAHTFDVKCGEGQ